VKFVDHQCCHVLRTGSAAKHCFRRCLADALLAVAVVQCSTRTRNAGDDRCLAVIGVWHSSMTSRRVASQMWAYATFGYKPAPESLIDELEAAALRILPTFSCQNISNTMWCGPGL
jgi:hypothetical protein